jgi:hypothetical protein
LYFVGQILDSASPISAVAAKAAGYIGKVRYVSSFTAKNYSVAERDADRAARFPVLLNFEDGAQDALGGASVGVAKAAIARPQLVTLEWPQDRPVPFSCDFDPTPDQFPACWDCIATFALNLGRPAAAYASWPLLAYCEARGMRYGWALGSSSFNTGPVPRRVLQQLAAQVTVGGVTCDLNEALAEDWGQVPAPVIPVPKPTPAPKEDEVDPAFLVEYEGSFYVVDAALKSKRAVKDPAEGSALIAAGYKNRTKEIPASIIARLPETP